VRLEVKPRSDGSHNFCIRQWWNAGDARCAMWRILGASDSERYREVWWRVRDFRAFTSRRAGLYNRRARGSASGVHGILRLEAATATISGFIDPHTPQKSPAEIRGHGVELVPVKQSRPARLSLRVWLVEAVHDPSRDPDRRTDGDENQPERDYCAEGDHSPPDDKPHWQDDVAEDGASDADHHEQSAREYDSPDSLSLHKEVYVTITIY
jgi:hypothetical protein